MSKSLTYGNIPIRRGRVQLGQQLRTADHANLVACAHEQWAASGEQVGGLLYDRAPWTTTLTSLGYGTGWALSRWQPLIHLRFEDTSGEAHLCFSAFVVNADVQVEVLTPAFGAVDSATILCTSGAAQWLEHIFVLDIATTPVVILRVSARRSTFAASGQIYHLGAIVRPDDASQLP